MSLNITFTTVVLIWLSFVVDEKQSEEFPLGKQTELTF